MAAIYLAEINLKDPGFSFKLNPQLLLSSSVFVRNFHQLCIFLTLEIVIHGNFLNERENLPQSYVSPPEDE